MSDFIIIVLLLFIWSTLSDIRGHIRDFCDAIEKKDSDAKKKKKKKTKKEKG